jgi:hypothetical protein
LVDDCVNFMQIKAHSIAPKAKSGTATRSILGNGYGISK